MRSKPISIPVRGRLPIGRETSVGENHSGKAFESVVYKTTAELGGSAYRSAFDAQGALRGDGAVTGENPYFGLAMEHFLAGDSSHVQRFLAIWEGVEPRRRKFRFSYPVIGPLNFQVQVNPADALGSIIFCDWVPVDFETWSRLEHLGG